MVVVGKYRSFLLDDNGNVWLWGSNENGQLGVGDFSSRSTPQLLSETGLQLFGFRVSRAKSARK